MLVQPSLDLDRLKQRWSQFTQTGQLPGDLDPLVAAAWQRCAPRLNPHRTPQWTALNDEVLALTLRHRQALVAVARPILEDLYQHIESLGVVLATVDSAGCLLDSLGDAPMAALLAGIGMRPGVFLIENRLGAIAFSSALLDGAPVQMTGAEHFLETFHTLSTAAAPIFALDGHTLGAVGLLMRAEAAHPFALGLMLAAARAIENQLRADALTTEANTRATELNTTLNASSDAVLVWDAAGNFVHVNEQAGSLLGLKPAAVMGRSVYEHIAFPETLARAVAQGRDLTEAEVTITTHGLPHACLASLRNIRAHPEAEPVHYIVTLKQIERVHALVNRLVGAQARLTLNDLVGQSTAYRRVRRQAQAAADARACVLIQGEAGTGKNSLARAIHNTSRRASNPFLSVNCRALPRELVLGEFLGYEAGAFGNTIGQPSKFELAHGGTLFLDEVDALPIDAQAALLRIIEAGDVIRLGGQRVIPVEVRVIAASHAALEARVAEGSFRADLSFRLSSFVIHMPPLRDCPEDVPALLSRVLERLEKQLGLPLQMTAAAREALLAYAWPGNIRELESVLERAALACEGERIAAEHLPAAVRERRAVRVAAGRGVAEPVRRLDEAERRAIISAFHASRGNLTQTASMLGIGRTTLWRKLKEFQISLESDYLS
jgi:transcriptional activator for dhaKLM operon